jgi:hypothetical protein
VRRSSETFVTSGLEADRVFRDEAERRLVWLIKRVKTSQYLAIYKQENEMFPLE